MAHFKTKVKPQLVIPMTGVSSRFTAAGYNLPKFLLHVNGQTIIEHVLDMFPDWEDVIFCCNSDHLDNPDLDLEALLKAKRPLSRIARINPHKKGPGWAVWEARDLINLENPVVVNYADFTCYWDSEQIAKDLFSGKVDGVIAAYTGFHPHMSYSHNYAYLKMSGQEVEDIQEKKPWTNLPMQELASSGTYGFVSGKLLLDSLEEQFKQDLHLNNEYYLSLTYKPILQSNKKVTALKIQHFMQWGTPQDLSEYLDYSNAISKWDSVRAGQQPNQPNFARIVLASGEGKRFSEAGYNIAKPLLTISNKTILEHSSRSVPGNKTVITSRPSVMNKETAENICSKLNAEYIELKDLTRGQAESALIALRTLDRSIPVIITSCDAISVVESATVEQAINSVGKKGLLVWAAQSFNVAKRNPEKFGWVDVDFNGMITQSWIKENPSGANPKMIIGTFGFGSVDYAIKSIEKLINSNKKVNGEFYLDSLIQVQKESGNICRCLLIDSFISVGTPEEYESAKYWQSCFDKWPLHPYKLINDPMLDQKDIAAISKEFRNFKSEV